MIQVCTGAGAGRRRGFPSSRSRLNLAKPEGCRRPVARRCQVGLALSSGPGPSRTSCPLFREAAGLKTSLQPHLLSRRGGVKPLPGAGGKRGLGWQAGGDRLNKAFSQKRGTGARAEPLRVKRAKEAEPGRELAGQKLGACVRLHVSMCPRVWAPVCTCERVTLGGGVNTSERAPPLTLGEKVFSQYELL